MRKVLLVLLAVCACLWISAENKKAEAKILFISSYDSSYKWSDDLYRSFYKYLVHYYEGNIDIDLMELSVMRTPDLKVLQKDVDSFLQMTRKKKYDLIVTSDNAATDLVLSLQNKISGETPVLFSGYANFDRSKRTRNANISGIERVHNFRLTLDIGLRMLPQTQKIAVITDASATGEALYQEFRRSTRDFKGPELLFLHGAFLSTSEMLARLAQLPADSFVILSNWRSGRPEPYVPFEIVYDKIQQTAQRPVFTLQNIAFDSGAIGGFLMSGAEYGVLTGKQALRILNGEKIAGIPIQLGTIHSVFNWETLKQWDVPRGALPFYTTFINKPPTVWQNWLTESMLVAILVLFLLIWLLIFAELKRRSRKKLNGLFSALPIHVGVTDAKNNILFLQAGNQFFNGNFPKKLNDLPVELLREIETPIRDVFQTGESSRKEYSVFGKHRQLEFLLLPRELFGKNAVMWIAADVTELHNAYTAMSRLAERFRLILESIGDAVIVTDCEGVVSLMNPMADKLTGCDEKQAIGKKLDDIFHLSDSSEDSPVMKAMRTGENVVLEGHSELISADGRKYRIAANAAPIREEDSSISGAVLFFRDITDEFQKQDMLFAQNAILLNASEIANIVYFRNGENGEIVPMGDFSKNWKMTNGKIVSAEEWIAPENLVSFLAERDRFLAGELHSIRIFYRSHPDYGHRYYEMRVVRPSGKKDEKVDEFYGIIQDITESRMNESRYKDSSSLLNSIMENLPGYIFVKNVDDNFRYVMCNRGFSILTGYSAENIIGKTDLELFIDNDYNGQILENDLTLLKTNRLLDVEEHFKDREGKKHTVRTMKTIVPQSDGTRLLLGMSVDITRQSHLEQERIRMIEQLNNYVQCEQIINQCLARISVENDFDKAVNEMLKVIGENAGADRCYIFKYTLPGYLVSDNIYEWVRDGIESTQSGLRNIATSSSWTRQLQAQRDIVIEDITAVPSELAEDGEFLANQNIKSLLVCGIWLNDELWGYIGMDFVKALRRFTESDIHTIHSSMKLFLLARERSKQMNAIADSVSLQRQIVDNIAIPIAIFDLDFKIVSANSSLCGVCHLPAEELIGKKCYDVICCCGKPPEWCPMRQTLSDFKFHSKEAEIHGRRFILNAQPIFNRKHELKYILKSAIDITELTQQKVQLQEAMETAQAADRAKSYFIATMSHELRTPLNAVIGYSELLQMGDCRPREEEMKDLQAINTAGHTLLNLIDDVLDYSKMETDRLEIEQEPMNLKKLFSEMLTIFRQTAENRKLPMELNLPEQLPWMILDQKRLRQILINLITYAFRNSRQGKITLSAAFAVVAEKEATGTLAIQLSGSGTENPSENPEHLFDPFRQHAVRGNKAYESTGLELALSQRLCGCMGGKIKAFGKPGDECGFSIVFENVPFVIAEQPPESSPVLPAEYEKTNLVILVDDVEMNLKVMSAMFQRLGIRYVCCSSAKEAIKEMENIRPVALFTDLWMPDMSGDELAEYMAKNPATANVPVVVVTADTQIDKSVRRFFKGILLKPLTMDALRKCLAELMPQLLDRETEKTGK